MKVKRIIQFFSYWKEVFLVSIACMTFLFIAEIYCPDRENPFYPNKLRTGVEVMAERWGPYPDINDPNFLRDYHKYMGYDFH